MRNALEVRSYFHVLSNEFHSDFNIHHPKSLLQNCNRIKMIDTEELLDTN
ncbi:MAG: hypothetical protein R2730_07705 [Chitinophagales bacterium]